MIELHLGDCLEILSAMPEMSVDAIVTDPPYGLSFMGKKWDYDVPDEAVWRECLRVLKPGGHLLCFAGTRTQHRMAVRIEDAGFEIRDMIAWVYGSGFPKSHDVSKAIDRAAGAEREVVERTRRDAGSKSDHAFEHSRSLEYDITAPATPEAQQWSGWGTALKPALEPITVARKPLIGTVAENVLRYGTGAINVDGCRVGRRADDQSRWSHTGSKASDNRAMSGGNYARDPQPDAAGRFPANLIHDGSEEVVGLFPERDGAVSNGTKGTTGSSGIYNKGWVAVAQKPGRADSGSAARFFYCAKASKADRDEGNHHPTVKPTDLMRYLCRLITPPGGIVLDPFMGSGSTGKAAVLEGFSFIGIERELEYIEIARARIHAAIPTDNATVYEQLSLC